MTSVPETTTSVFAHPRATDWHRRIAEQNTILRSPVGSDLHGTGIGGGDRDEKGVCIEPPECVIGLRPFEQYEDRSTPAGQRSGPGDLEVTIYGLRKFAALAANGNPESALLLFAPGDKLVGVTAEGLELQAHPELFLSKDTGRRFAGHLADQRDRITGSSTRGRHTNRPELIAEHGYDCKYAYIAIRLGLQGAELMNTGRIALPMSSDNREYLVKVRRGQVRYDQVLDGISMVLDTLVDAIPRADLPEHCDRERLDRWLVTMYRSWWDRHFPMWRQDVPT